MSRSYLFGPVSKSFADQNLSSHRADGRCRIFDVRDGLDVTAGFDATWDDVQKQFPEGWQPEFIALFLQYRTVPEWVWQAPIPIVGLAGDWNLLWTAYRQIADNCDLVLADQIGVETFRKAGIDHAAPAILYGAEKQLLDYDWPESERDIDILFVGNFHPVVQSERLLWLERVAQLSSRWNVVFRSGVFGQEYWELLSRARIVFNRGIRREWNCRVTEALAAGALLFQEAGNLEVAALLADRNECVFYDDDNLEELLQHYLEHEDERRTIAEAGRRRVEEFLFSAFWDRQLAFIDDHWPEIQEKASGRTEGNPVASFLQRTSQYIHDSFGSDPALIDDLREALRTRPRCAALHNALGIALACGDITDGSTLAQIAGCFQHAWHSDSSHVVAGLNLAESLLKMGQKEHAKEQALRTLAVLERADVIADTVWDAPLFPVEFSRVRIEWERASWRHAGDRHAEQKAKRDLLRWALHLLLGDIGDDLSQYYEAVVVRPDIPNARGSLGCALGRRKQPVSAAVHLREAVRTNPCDMQGARAFYAALGEATHVAEQQQFARRRWLFHKAAPNLLPVEPWFAQSVDEPFDDAADKTDERKRIVWEGSQQEVHSLALVNRHICERLLVRGHDVFFVPPKVTIPGGKSIEPPPAIRERLDKPLPRSAAVHIAHQWPPNFEPPNTGRWIVMQPWEFGSIPKAWLGPMTKQIDDVWVPSEFVRKCFVQSGVPVERVHVVPLGVSPSLFENPTPYSFHTEKRFKFLFVGGTIHRKGIDLLLKTFPAVFSDCDDVCLVIKDMGVGTFYQGQTVENRIAELQKQPHCPAIEYISCELSDSEMAGLYAGCDCLVHPYRGEGFGLPIAEAMANGLPVIITGYGAALDYCSDETAYLLPARLIPLPENRIDREETVGRPWLAEPDLDMLRYYLRNVYEHPEKARLKAAKAKEHIRRNFTWERTVSVVERRLREVCERPIRRSESSGTYRYIANAPKVSLCMIVKNEEHNLPHCLESVGDLVNEIIVVDTGSEDATKDIAAKMGAKVFDFPWIDHFAAARNENLRHATGKWIFWMDADDRVDAENRPKLKRLFDSLGDENAAYVMNCKCLPDPATKTATLVDHVRLFRNHPEMRWQYRIHEQILGSVKKLGGHVRWSDVVINHTGYLDPNVRQRKLQRDLRILTLEYHEQPNDPFTLFNMGSTYIELRRWSEALAMLQKSLQHSHRSDSIVRKLYVSIAQCQKQLGHRQEAMQSFAEGRRHYPNDAELSFREGVLRYETGDLPGAETCFLHTLQARDENHFGSVIEGIQGYKSRYYLAVIYNALSRFAEAETQWKAALAEKPDFVAGWAGLADLFFMQKRWADVETVISRLQALGAKMQHLVLRARLDAARVGDLAAVQKSLEEIIAEFPNELYPRIVLSEVLMANRRNWPAAELVLREILRMCPEHHESKKRMQLIQRETSGTD